MNGKKTKFYRKLINNTLGRVAGKTLKEEARTGIDTVRPYLFSERPHTKVYNTLIEGEKVFYSAKVETIRYSDKSLRRQYKNLKRV